MRSITSIQGDGPHELLNFDTLTNFATQLYGDANDNILVAWEPDADLYGYGGNDILIGAAGNNALIGGTGDDTYAFAEGWGLDSITEQTSEGADTIEFTDLARAEVRLYITSTNGTVYIENKADPGDKITIAAGNSGGHTLLGQKVESIEFTDTTLDLTGGLTLEGSDSDESSLYGTGFADIIYGYGGRDWLYGQGGNDTLIAGDGDDVLNGGEGNDIFIYSEGLDSVKDTAGTDTLWITGGVTVNEITFSNVSTYNTKITITASINEVTVVNLRHGDSDRHIETLRFDDGFETDQLPDYNNWYWGTSRAFSLWVEP